MIDRKKLIIIGIVAFIGFLFFVLIVISAFTSKSEVPEETQIEPTSTELLIPTSSSTIIDPPDDEIGDTVQLVTTDPADGVIDQTTALQVVMTFSEPMKERAFYYKVNPASPTLISSGGNDITITPRDVWPFGENTITVFAESESLSGKRLSTPFTYRFTVKDLPYPDEEIE